MENAKTLFDSLNDKTRKTEQKKQKEEPNSMAEDYEPFIIFPFGSEEDLCQGDDGMLIFFID